MFHYLDTAFSRALLLLNQKELCQLSVANRNLIHSASILSLTTLFYVHFRDCKKKHESCTKFLKCMTRANRCFLACVFSTYLSFSSINDRESLNRDFPCIRWCRVTGQVIGDPRHECRQAWLVGVH